jgi:hypothetical protein
MGSRETKIEGRQVKRLLKEFKQGLEEWLKW